MAFRTLRISRSPAVRKYARLLIDQYGSDAEELAEIGIIEMLAAKNGPALVAWALIFAEIQSIASNETERC